MNLTKIKFFLLGFFILGIINIPLFSYAENEIEVSAGSISLDTSPKNPEPYENVTVNLSSYATDLNKANITWQMDGNIVLSGMGKTSYSFQVGGVGSSNVFNISISPVGSMSTINKKATIYPSEVEIMWESVSGYTPPFYKGKALPISGSLIKAVAIPNTNTIRSGNGSISYTWKTSDSVDQDASGYNKNSYIFKNSVLDKSNNVGVLASSVAGNYSAEKSIDIPIYNPKLVFYKRDPAEGILYNDALNKETFMTESEMTLIATPYFMPIKTNVSDLSYSWKINDKSIATPSKKTELTVRPTSRSGYANIEIAIENINEMFQKLSGKLKITVE